MTTAIRFSRFLAVLCCFALTSLCFAQPVTTNEPTIGPAKGSLLIIGGGAMGQELWSKFIELAGGEKAQIVVIPTADVDSGVADDPTVDLLKELGVAEVTVLHTRDRSKADSEAFVAPLKTATGVWLGGGRQWRLADAYLNTRTHTELNALLERGGVIGGSSAGATIQGSFLVRGDTKGNELMIGDHIEGMGFLKKSAIDQHLLRRNRQFDLIPVIEKYPELLGIGLDEATGIVVQGNQFTVVGISYVAVYDANQWKETAEGSSKKGRFILLSRGERYDLKERKPLRATRSFE